MVNEESGRSPRSTGAELSVTPRTSGAPSSSIVRTIYLSHILTSWGDRMWNFAVGLYLGILFPESFQYTAIFGFTSCICVIAGGPCIGKWVDKSSRLRAATLAIAVQNGAVIVCALVLILMLRYGSELQTVWTDILFLMSITLFAVIAELASVANKIAIEKDWIVVLADNNEASLSNMNAFMRTIDLTTSILAPAVVAQIIAFVSKIAGASFIACWNLVSGVAEIYLLYKIFNAVPQLAQKSLGDGNLIKMSKTIPQIHLIEIPPTPTPTIISNLNSPADESKMPERIPTPSGAGLGLSAQEFSDVILTPAPTVKPFPGGVERTPMSYKSTPESVLVPSSTLKLIRDTAKQSFFPALYFKVFEALKGWPEYFHHPLRFAGIGLAVLYMTVLGFDIITIAYMTSQGVHASLIGIAMGVGALSGILGSLSFPYLRKTFGKCAVGNFGFGFETSCLVLCVVSVFLPGSPFIDEKLWLNTPKMALTNDTMISTPSSTSGEIGLSTSTPVILENYKSVIVFITGILISRYGLWIADLTVTQLFQEEVVEHKRGILNGVQDSLNQSFNLLKFFLVILFPHPSSFGSLIITSWVFVFLGWIFFMVFTCSWRRRMMKISSEES